VAKFTRAYEAARFGKSVDDAQQLPGLFEDIAAGEMANSDKTRERTAVS